MSKCEAKQNLVHYLKKNKVIVFKGSAKGGRVNNIPSYRGS